MRRTVELSRTVKAVGGVITAVAVMVVLAFAYLDPGASAPTPAPTTTRGCTVASTDPYGLAWVCLNELPIQAQQTVALIDAGGPFPYDKDGATFNNFEGVLPEKPRGYYREYTVQTAGERDRGIRRIVTGDRHRELFYTADHYESFVRVQR